MFGQMLCVCFVQHTKGGVMRLFNLFLRRAGVQSVPARGRKPAASRLTVVCSRDHMADVRRTLYKNFESAGLKVGSVQVSAAADPALVSACVTVSCSPEMRPVLMKQARDLTTVTGVRHVRWGDHRHIVLN
jgi:hypothetical protein